MYGSVDSDGGGAKGEYGELNAPGGG